MSNTHEEYPIRCEVLEKDWNKPCQSYRPPTYTSKRVSDQYTLNGKNGWADCNRDSEPGLLRNPKGRTGLTGRGLLGRYGPNNAADLFLFKRDPTDQDTIFFVAVRRKDAGVFAMPGGMINRGEIPYSAAIREFCEEAQFEKKNESLKKLFDDKKPMFTYSGYVDDPRNTDVAWMWTTAFFIDASGVEVELSGNPDEVTEVAWLRVHRKNGLENELYASHGDIISKSLKSIF